MSSSVHAPTRLERDALSSQVNTYMSDPHERIEDMDYDVEFGSITVSAEPWRRGNDAGCLYVVEFDSGWVKIGRSTTWSNRRQQLTTEFGRRYGWSITRDWQSGLVCAIRHPNTPRSTLGDLEIRLRTFVSRQDGVQVFSDQLPRRGRGTSGAGESETFRGSAFGDLVAYADVLALCSPPDCCSQ
jgi:hypothetical protein